jgi:two-component system phosphate regulon sensor histidine kinase PhoR
VHDLFKGCKSLFNGELPAVGAGQQIRKERIDLNELCANAVDTIKKDEIDNIELIYQGEPAMVYGNRELIESIIFNLCENAIRYNVENGKVFVTVSGEDDSSVLEVKDTGIGIDPKDHERIFERFYRGSACKSGRIPGSGLGLAMVKEIAELHGGRAAVESELGKGSVFTVTI